MKRRENGKCQKSNWPGSSGCRWSPSGAAPRSASSSPNPSRLDWVKLGSNGLKRVRSSPRGGRNESGTGLSNQPPFYTEIEIPSFVPPIIEAQVRWKKTTWEEERAWQRVFLDVVENKKKLHVGGILLECEIAGFQAYVEKQLSRFSFRKTDSLMKFFPHGDIFMPSFVIVWDVGLDLVMFKLRCNNKKLKNSHHFKVICSTWHFSNFFKNYSHPNPLLSEVGFELVIKDQACKPLQYSHQLLTFILNVQTLFVFYT